MSGGVHWHQQCVTSREKAAQKGQLGCIVWLTGLSGAGKSTVANALDKLLTDQGKHCALLDGDNVRHGLNNNLGFSPEDRKENVRRLGEVAILLAEAGLIVIVAATSPYQDDRDAARQRCTCVPFMEVYMATPLATCEARDPKGLYAKARRHEIIGMTGIDAPYEEPVNAELRLGGDGKVPNELAGEIKTLLDEQNITRVLGSTSVAGASA
ncbi:adenylylsulfate kinase [Tribonema minus]|uniref:Adenylyl-sulfate kinase n=1 Tax=Tribonema minus TaxID=303371 RepID=A0A835YN65_9STRA|nr:adenylylsulfate kinase [Tribonema minus]